MSTGEVYLGLYGENFDPDEVSNFIGLKASSVKRKGERDSRVPLPQMSTWKYSLGKIESDFIDVYEMADDLVDHLRPFEAKIAEAIKKFGLSAELQIVLWIDQNESASMPAIGFERPVLDFVHAIEATIDIDTYRN